MKSDIFYSHLPVAGISVGFKLDQHGNLILAASFVNDGQTQRGFERKERRDTFSRTRAREIISGRIKKCIDTDGAQIPKFTDLYLNPGNFKLGDFVANFRKKFKPDPKETELKNREYWDRHTMDTEQYWHDILDMVTETISGFSPKQVLPEELKLSGGL